VVSSSKNDSDLVGELCKGKSYCVQDLSLNIREISIIFKKSKAVIANNGAATDVCWTVGGNLVYLADGVVDLDINLPLKKSKIVKPLMPCFPYSEGIKKIKVSEVIDKIQEFIENK